jgi:hypothetical protein
MEATIKLTKFVSQDENLPDAQRQSWPVQILAEGTNIEDHIFVYHVGTQNDPLQGDRFECVASVNQLYEIPKNQGVSLTTQTGIPYYRSNVLSYVARSASEAQTIWTDVVTEVEWLVKNWNASLKLQAVEFATITETLTETTDTGMNPPVRLMLSYHPAGSASTDGEGKPIIINPDTTQVGWLPVSVLGAGAEVPPGAAFYYNLATDESVSDEWPPKQPYSGNQFYRNGIQMPYGLVWTITDRTIWWMDFNIVDVPGYERLAEQSADWGAPWPQDYVNRSSPGATPNQLALILFK